MSWQNNLEKRWLDCVWLSKKFREQVIVFISPNHLSKDFELRFPNVTLDEAARLSEHLLKIRGNDERTE